jgi:hypothetical protein
MGYRSDVSVVFYTIDKQTLPFAAIKLWFDENYPVKEAAEWGAEITYGGDYVLVEYNDVKWYPDYEHVQAVRTSFEAFDLVIGATDSGTNAAWEMAEVGENMDHIEATRSDYCTYRLDVVREFATEQKFGWYDKDKFRLRQQMRAELKGEVA